MLCALLRRRARLGPYYLARVMVMGRARARARDTVGVRVRVRNRVRVRVRVRPLGPCYPPRRRDDGGLRLGAAPG